jgi:integrase
MGSEKADMTPISQDQARSLKVYSFEQAKSLRDNLIWEELDKTTVEEAVILWLATLSHKTRVNYQSRMRKLATFGFIDPSITLQAFALVNHNNILDGIKLVHEWAECSRQARAVCYISFTRFLSRRTHGIIPRAIPNRESGSKTFFKVYEKVKTEAMTQAQWIRFLEELEKIAPRECLIAKVILQGGKRVSEVLTLKVDQVDFERRKIFFRQSKTKGLKKETVITYPESIMEKLRTYIGDRKGYVFVSRFGKPVDLRWLARSFEKAGKHAGLSFKITPHVLRASTVTYLKQQGFADSEIMKITGHANAGMVHAYDKSSREKNPSEKIWLVS